MNTIHLVVRDGAWHAEFRCGDQPDPDMVSALGTHIVPTAFLSATPATEVVAQIQRLNPDHHVTPA